MSQPLDLDGELVLDFEGGRIWVEFRNDTLEVRIPDARTALSLFRQVSGSTRRAGLRRMDHALRMADLSARLWIGGRTIGQLGGEARAGLLSRLLRVEPLALRLLSLIGALLARDAGTDPSAP